MGLAAPSSKTAATATANATVASASTFGGHQRETEHHGKTHQLVVALDNGQPIVVAVVLAVNRGTFYKIVVQLREISR